jgi:hypothetical protein
MTYKRGVWIGSLVCSLVFASVVVAEESAKVKGQHVFSYGLSVAGTPKKLNLPTQLLHKLAYENRNALLSGSAFYVFLGLGNDSKVKNNTTWELTSKTNRAAENTFQLFQVGGGMRIYPFKGTFLAKKAAAYWEVALNTYIGQTSSMDLNGMYLAMGVDYTVAVTKRLSVVPSAGLAFEHIGSGSIGDESGKLDPSISGFTGHVGVRASYIF